VLNPAPIAYSLDGAAKAISQSRDTIERSFHLGRSHLVRRADLVAYVVRLAEL
jgi:hypothetical protein